MPIHGLVKDYMPEGTLFLFFDLSNGKQVQSWDPNSLSPGAGWYLSEYRAVAGSDKTVLGFQNEKEDTVLVLTDLVGKRLWARRFPHTPSVPDERRAFMPSYLFLDESETDHFATLFGTERVEFSTVESGGKWEAVELARVAYDPDAKAKSELAAIPEITLKPTQTVLLKSKAVASAPSTSAIHDVRHFIHAGTNRFAYIEGWIAKDTSLVMVDTSGKVLGEFDLKKLRDVGPDYLWLRDKVFLVSKTGNSFGKASAEYWRVDLASGKFEVIRFPGVTWQMEPKIAVFKSGKLALVGSTTFGNYMGDGIAVYDNTGKLLFLQRLDKLTTDGLFFVQDITIDSKDRLVLVDDIGHEVLYLSQAAKVLKSSPLRISGKDLGGVSDVRPDPRGGLILYASWYAIDPADPTMYHLDDSGKIVPLFRPRYPDGKSFTYLNAVSLDANGNYWTSDEHSLVKLDSKGVVRETLGATVEPDVISDVADIQIGADKSIYIVDNRSMTVHAFSADGSEKYIFRTTGLDFPGGRTTGLSVNRDSSAFLGTSTKGEVVIGADGKPAGFWGAPAESFSLRNTSSEAADGMRWTLDYGAAPIVLSDKNGKVLKRIGKRSDGGLVGMATQLESALDGSVCVESQPSPEGGLGAYMGPKTLCTFGPEGDPLGSFLLPSWGWARVMAFDGRYVFVDVENAVVCFDINGKALWRTSTSFVPEGQWPRITRDGKYFFVGTPREVTFYELPHGSLGL